MSYLGLSTREERKVSLELLAFTGPPNIIRLRNATCVPDSMQLYSQGFKNSDVYVTDECD